MANPRPKRRGITAQPKLDFRLLFESAPGPLVVLLPDDPIFTIVAVSDAYLAATHKSRDELIGQGIFEVFFHSDDPTHAVTSDSLRASFSRAISTSQPDSMAVQKYTLATESGPVDRYWSPVNSPVLSGGSLQYIIHRVEDVTEFVRLKKIEAEHGKLTDDLIIRSDQVEAELIIRSRQLAEPQRLLRERREVEEKLSASEARFSMAFSEAPIGMVLTTSDGRIIEVNQAYLDMLGCTREELNAQDSSLFTHPDDIGPTREFLASLQSGERTSSAIEKRYIRKDGTVLWARASATMRRDDTGNPLQLIAIIEDITERKSVEERLRAIYDGTYEYIGLLSTDGTLLEANRASLDFAGNKREDVVGRPFWETPWFTFTPGASSQIRDGVSRAAAGEFVRYEATLRRPTGQTATFDISLHPVRNQRGEVVLIVPEGRDISELRVLELRDAFLVRLDDSTRPLTDPHELTQTIAGLLGDYLQVNRCAYADVEADEDTFNLTGDYNRGVSSIVGRYQFAQFGRECLRLMREGKPYVVEDAETDPRVVEVVESYRATEIRSVICVSLLKAGKFVAAMAVHQVTPRKWRQDEIELVHLVSNRCWESIERAHVTRELREREQRFRFLAESIPQMVWTASPDGMLDYVNSQVSRYFGASMDSLLGAGWLAHVHPEDQNPAAVCWMHSIATGEDYETSFRLHRGADDTWRWHLVRALPLIGAAGKVVQWFGTCTDIEDQKRAEGNLRQQWHTFDAALSHTPDFTYVFDLDGRFTYVNRSLLALWRKPLDEALGKNFFDLEYPPQLAQRLQHQIQQVIETVQPVRDQTPFTGPDGQTRYYDYIFVPVLDDQGHIEAVAGSTRDITEQNQAAQQIQEDRRRWRDLLLQVPAGVAIFRGREHRFNWVNGSYLALVDRQEDSLIGRTVLDVFPEVEQQEFLKLLDNVFDTGKAIFGHESALQLTATDGARRDLYVNFVYTPTRDAAGIIDGIFVHASDVTATVVARKQVEESERQFRTLAETIPHLAWMADESGFIFWYNRRWFDYTGTTLQQMQGWGWKVVHDPAVLPQVMINWTIALNSGEPFEMVFPLKGADGAFRSFLTRVEPVKDNQGKVVRWFGTNTDITEQRRTEEELRRMNRELEEFAYVASHDLQEPLRMVNIYTQLILRTLGETEGKLSQYSAFVRQGVLRMESLIQDLLTFSRTVHTEEQPIGVADLSESLKEALSVLKNRIEETGAVISAGDFPLVRGDTSQMAHVFQNIISNALKYSKAGQKPQIRITVQLGAQDCVVSVQDNGIGFDPLYAERIFGLFKRLHKDEYPGTGLGLAICKRIIERYRGRMWADGHPGQGATFHFSLPRVEAN